jgi:tRNA(Ile)-lysidine synthase
MSDPSDPLVAAVAAAGLLAAGETAVVLASGGADSACAVAGTAGLLGSGRVRALHLNYGLREDSGSDEQACRELCAALGVELSVERPRLAGGNLQAAAREARYAAAEEMRERIAADWIVTGHTRTDLAETVLYRLVSAPGRRALLGLAPRRGRVVRPLLALPRRRTRELATAAGLSFRDDPSNAEPAYARNRIRNEVLPVLAEIAPAAEQTIASTWAELAEESEALEALAERALAEAGAGGGAVAASGAALAELPPALARLALRRLAERSAGRQVALGGERSAEILRLARSPEGGVVELGSGVEAQIEHGHVRFRAERPAEAAPAQVNLQVPGGASFGEWRLRAELLDERPAAFAGPEEATLDAEALGGELVVRSWRDGDRMRPLGLEGSKSLQDLFTDAKVPRSLRRRLPVVVAAGRIAWVAGVAVSEEFKLREGGERAVLLTARAAL